MGPKVKHNVLILLRTASIVVCGVSVCLLAESKVAWSVASIVGVTSLFTFLEYISVHYLTNKYVVDSRTDSADKSTNLGACTSVYSVMAAGIFVNFSCIILYC